PLIDENPQNAAALAMEVIEAFPGRFELAIETGWCHKIGLPEAAREDAALAPDLLSIMTEQCADFTLTFRAHVDELIAGVEPEARAETAIGANAGLGAGEGAQPARDLFDPAAFDAWAARWRTRRSMYSIRMPRSFAQSTKVAEAAPARCRHAARQASPSTPRAARTHGSGAPP